MDDIIYLPTAILILLLVAGYLVQRLVTKKQPVLTQALVLALAAPGIVGGVVLIASTFNPNLARKLVNLKLYILISGIVLIWLSTSGTFRVFAPAPKDVEQDDTGS